MLTPAMPSRLVTSVIVPGWQDSGPGHWQTLWHDAGQGTVRVVQEDWWQPKRASWVQRLEDLILAQPGQVVLIAHSLGCITSVNLRGEALAKVQGALLVAPADPERRGVLSDFAPVPHQRLPYRSIVVASDNDPFCPVRLAGGYARAWGSEFVRLRAAGHINVASGHGEWPLGRALWQSLLDVPFQQSAGGRGLTPDVAGRGVPSGNAGCHG